MTQATTTLTCTESFLAGDGGAKLLARQSPVSEEKIRTWVGHYRLHGVEGLRHKRSTYSAQFRFRPKGVDRASFDRRPVYPVSDILNRPGFCGGRLL